MATRDTASSTSMRVKPPSEYCGTGGEHIGTDLKHSLRGPAWPQDLNLYFPYNRQWGGGDNFLPAIIRRAIRLLRRGLRAQGGREGLPTGFTEGEEGACLRFDQFLLGR